MKTAQDVVGFFQANLGLGEDPPGSNCNWISRWFGVGCVAWCVETCSRAANEAWGDPDVWQVPGIKPDYRKGFAYVWGIASAFERAGRFDRTPKVGSFVCFNWNGAGAARNSNSHIGVVEQVVGDGTVVTLEGNVDDQIARKRRSMQFIEGFCHPPYEDTQEDDLTADEHKTLYEAKNLANRAMAAAESNNGELTKLAVAIRDPENGLVAKLDEVLARLLKLGG